MYNIEFIEQYITNQTQESLKLEYKAAASLSRKDEKIKDISKDISAMANSSGGLIIYGIKEYDPKINRYLPEKIDPVDSTEFSKEWLENIITGNIHPKISDLRIHPIHLSSSNPQVIFVVEIPQSTTAHQANDNRYYKRHNFQAMPMQDYEVRDVMNRASVPHVDLQFGIFYDFFSSQREHYDLRVRIRNVSELIVHHFKAIITLTNVGWHSEGEIYEFMMIDRKIDDDSIKYSTRCGFDDDDVSLTLIYQSVSVIFPSEEIDISQKIKWGYQVPNFDDYLEETESITSDLDEQWRKMAEGRDWRLNWKLYADNMPAKQGSLNIWELPFDFPD